MLVIPAIDLKDGKTVQLVGGVFGSEEVVIEDIAGVAKDFYDKGMERLHVVDLNAAKNIGNNIEIIKDILAGKKVKVEVGGGIRSVDKAKELISYGADWVIVGTAATEDPDFLKILADAIGRDKIIVSLDYKEKRVLTHGWDRSINMSPMELGKKLQDYCGAFLFTCVDKEGKLEGPDTEYLKELVEGLNVPVIASGGVGKLDDIMELKEVGVFGVVVGMAVYKGNIDLREAIEKAND